MPGQDQLDRAALGADDEVDALGVAIETVADLSIDDQDEPDGADAQREQQHVEQRAERTRAQVAPGQLQQIHARAPPRPAWQRSCRGIRDFRRRVVRGDRERHAPARCAVPSNRSATEAHASSSRFDVGSSASSSLGRFTSARAMATRCCCPTESSMRIGVDAVRRRPARRASHAPPRGRPAGRRCSAQPAGSAARSSVGSRWNCCSTMPIWRPRKRSRAAAKAPTDPVRRRRPARRGQQQPGDQVQQRRLAAAGGADDEDVALPASQHEFVQRAGRRRRRR